MRVSRQPCGLLPVTSITRSRAPPATTTGRGGDERPPLAVGGLFRVIGQAPRVGRTNNPDQDFAEIFGLDAHSSSYGIRHVMGELYTRQLWTYLVTAGPESNLEFWWKKHKELTKTGLDAAGVTWDPLLAFKTYSGLSRMLRGPVAQAEAAAEDAPLNPNYIKLLLDASDLQALRQETFGVATPRGLLYSVLRHALLLAYWKSAARLRFDITRSGVLPWKSKIFSPRRIRRHGNY